jgi:hypothetical protein
MKVTIPGTPGTIIVSFCTQSKEAPAKNRQVNSTASQQVGRQNMYYSSSTKKGYQMNYYSVFSH